MAKKKVEVTVLVGTVTEGDQSAGPNESIKVNASEVEGLVRAGIVRTGKPETIDLGSTAVNALPDSDMSRVFLDENHPAIVQSILDEGKAQVNVLVIDRAFLDESYPEIVQIILDEGKAQIKPLVVDLSFLMENHPGLVKAIMATGVEQAPVLVVDRAFLDENHPDLVNEILGEGVEEGIGIDVGHFIDVKIAIEALDPDDESSWTEDGLPVVSAIEGLVGGDVTAAERDIVYQYMQKTQVGI